MPVISRFYGIVIKMFFDDHNPPHIHAVYGEFIGTINIKTGEQIVGDLPRKALKLINEWLDLHKDEILKMWETQKIDKLPPL